MDLTANAIYAYWPFSDDFAPHASQTRKLTLFNLSTLVSGLLHVGHSRYSLTYRSRRDVNSCGSFFPTNTALSPAYCAGVANSFERYCRIFSGSRLNSFGNSAKLRKNVLLPCHIISTLGSSNLEPEVFLVSDILSWTFFSNFSY